MHRMLTAIKYSRLFPQLISLLWQLQLLTIKIIVVYFRLHYLVKRRAVNIALQKLSGFV